MKLSCNIDKKTKSFTIKETSLNKEVSFKCASLRKNSSIANEDLNKVPITLDIAKILYSLDYEISLKTMITDASTSYEETMALFLLFRSLENIKYNLTSMASITNASFSGGNDIFVINMLSYNPILFSLRFDINDGINCIIFDKLQKDDLNYLFESLRKFLDFIIYETNVKFENYCKSKRNSLEVVLDNKPLLKKTEKKDCANKNIAFDSMKYLNKKTFFIEEESVNVEYFKAKGFIGFKNGVLLKKICKTSIEVKDEFGKSFKIKLKDIIDIEKGSSSCSGFDFTGYCIVKDFHKKYILASDSIKDDFLNFDVNYLYKKYGYLVFSKYNTFIREMYTLEGYNYSTSILESPEDVLEPLEEYMENFIKNRIIKETKHLMQEGGI